MSSRGCFVDRGHLKAVERRAVRRQALGAASLWLIDRRMRDSGPCYGDVLANKANPKT